MITAIDPTICDDLIRSGQTSELYSYLERKRKKKLSHEDRLLWARCCRRTGESRKALRTLIRLKKENKDALLHFEIQKEYALSLIYLGLSEEALKAIRELPDGYQKFELLGQHHQEDWNASEALKNYLKALQCPNLEPYRRINLTLNAGTASLETQDWDQAERLLLEVVDRASEQKFVMQHDFALEFLVEMYLLRGKFSEALVRSEAFLGGREGLSSYHNFLRTKVDLLVQAYTQGKDLRPLERKARELGYFEIERHIKFHRYVIAKDQKLGHELYWGTKNIHFRSSLLKIGFNLEEACFLVNKNLEFDRSPKNATVLKIEVEAGNFGNLHLNPQTMIGRLSREFLTEIQKPLSLGQLFSRLFPEEKYLGSPSLNRIQQGVQRLKVFFKKAKLPLAIQEINGSFRVRILEPVLLDFQPSGSLSVMEHRRIFQFRSKQSGYFVREDWERELGLSPRKSQRDLARFRDLGLIEKSGKAKWTKYLFIAPFLY